MSQADDEVYASREQTQIKHYILRHYLERFAHIVGSRWESITYVDGFAGPWNVRSPDLADSSFALALSELRKARDTHGQRGKSLRLRCYFLEQDRKAFIQLRDFAEQVKDADVEVRNGSFEDSISSILSFIRKDFRTFPFVFIDPTGWTGFTREVVSPLLQLDPGEVLINLMTGHIRRFPNERSVQKSLARLFGPMDFKQRIAGLSGIDLDDELVSCYRDVIEQEGRFPYVLSAIVLHPEIDRTHFHLIYATRHPKGVEVFKDIEKKAMAEMERVRAQAQKRRQEERSGQLSFSMAEEAPPSQHYHFLRERYLGRAKEAVLARLRRYGRVAYHEIWAVALAWPLVWESDLKGWIAEWQREGCLHIEGLGKWQRVPSREQSHFLIFNERAARP